MFWMEQDGKGKEGCFGLFIIFSNFPLAKEQDGDIFVIHLLELWYFGNLVSLVISSFGTLVFFRLFWLCSEGTGWGGGEGSFGGGQMRCHQESVCVAHKRHLLNILATMRFLRLKTYFLTGYLTMKGVNHLSFSSRTHDTYILYKRRESEHVNAC